MTNPAPGLHLITGRAGSGKTRALCDAVAAHMRRGERAILIVPEQHTFEAERRVAELGGGLIGVQVLSLERLCERVLEQAGDGRTFLSAQGVQMVVRRAAIRRQDELSCFSRIARLGGFAAGIAALIGACKQACITPDMLLDAANRLPGHSLLADTLHDTAILYEDTEDYLGGRYLTADDALLAAIARLPGSFAAGVPVYVDGLPAATQQVYRLMEALLKTASSVTVALTLDPEAPDADVFEPNAAARDALCRMADACGLPLFSRHLDGRRAAEPALMALERRLHAYPDRPYAAGTDALTVYGMNSRTSEVRALADNVLMLARAGMRYRDMAVLVSDMDAYGGLLERVLTARGIPFFLDVRRGVRDHAAAELLLAAMRAAVGGFSQADVLSLVKTGFVGVAHADAEQFENYVLRFGVRHGMFLSAFTRGDAPEPAEAVRQAVMEPLESLRQALAEPSVSGKVRALYDYLVRLDVRGQLERRAEALRAEGRVPLSEEHAQVWNALMQLLGQLDAIMGGERMSRAAFLTVLEEGLSDTTLGVIPDTSDRLRLSPLSRSGGSAVRALFVLGCSEGILPRDHGDDGLINESEQDTLCGLGLPRMHGAAYLTAHERLTLYEALSRPTERLYLFYPFTGDAGELLPSPLVTRIRSLFPNAAYKTDLTGADALPCCRADALERLTGALRCRAEDGAIRPELPALAAYFAKAEPPLLERLLAAGRTGAGEALPASLARALYGDRLRMSASRLEQFNACPFRHFVTYGLRAGERPEYREKAADLGTFYHDALNLFFRRAKEQDLSARMLTAEQQQTLLDEILPELIAAHNDGVLAGSERLRQTLFLMVETLRQSIAAIIRQLAAGGFEPVGTEVRFGEGCAFPPILIETPSGARALLHGVIDRLDCADGGVCRVVDYKTGGRSLEFDAIAAGLTLQLPLYLAAVLGFKETATPAGMYYMPLRVPPVKDGEDVETALIESFRLRGLTLSEPRVIELTDRALCAGRSSAVVQGLSHRKDGSLSGPVASLTEFEALLRAAKSKAAASLDEMLEGVAAASPAEGACRWCEYRSLCRFDPKLPHCRVRRRSRLTKDAFFRLLGDQGTAPAERERQEPPERKQTDG